ncbi:uncharacterized protein LOC129243503 [Anastrepha obliqua]|uniref:uncharacterized protein LOC129243503 n=1 Tax=Anastrepha obliqua TaxID=95512 RepID=UPI00240980EC|nr:uncharacterized protein LOC129243503 [Anastrepha obliqua]
MFSKVFAAVLVAVAILHQAASASVPDSPDSPDIPDTPEAREAPNSLDAPLEPAAEIEGRATNFLGVRNWNENAIDKRYSVSDLPALAFALDNIYNGNFESFKKMVNLHLYLFKKFDDNGDVNDKYTFNVAYYFSKIKNNGFYSSLTNSVKRTLNNYISYLPPSLDFLFFQSSFCLMNRKYLTYSFASDMHIDQQRDYVFVWNNNNNQKVAWTKELSDVSNNRQTKLKFSLKNLKTRRYAYLERNSYAGKTNLLTVWRSSNGKPSHADWTVSLYQNQLIFSQSGRVICASTSLYDQSRRYVYGMDKNGEDVPACQWYAKECP